MGWYALTFGRKEGLFCNRKNMENVSVTFLLSFKLSNDSKEIWNNKIKIWRLPKKNPPFLLYTYNLSNVVHQLYTSVKKFFNKFLKKTPPSFWPPFSASNSAPASTLSADTVKKQQCKLMMFQVWYELNRPSQFWLVPSLTCDSFTRNQLGWKGVWSQLTSVPLPLPHPPLHSPPSDLTRKFYCWDSNSWIISELIKM